MIRRVALVLAAFALLAAGCSSGGGDPSPSASELINDGGSGPYQGFGLTPPQPRPSFSLTDTAGRAFSFGTVTAKHPTMLFFGYTNCPDVCPTTMAAVASALREQQQVAKDTYVVFVTTDVKRDTGPVLARWLANFSRGTAAHFVGLTGTQAQVDAAQAAAHVTVAEDNGQTHSSKLLLFGPDDYARVAFAQSGRLQAQIAHDLPVVAKG
ncbi:protein SCO1/2 [Jatrophihabitans endophyticus]|uniref:Protein SCO1/2 n=1 Tax=Jatrophihabitans endophyticus TaxID=1206085 RepID=A0A1M5RXH7_9ACTN|nr:SCO family protein [Jatrophihabitans endophyticus]SHH30899.1 protein SCO1/2 [Jatrophihabitans endophyticus]